MIIFLCGPDSYRRRQKEKEYIGRYRQKYLTSANFDFSDSSDETFLKLREFSANYSIFEQFKMAILENIFEISEKEEKTFISFLKENLKNKDLTILISEEKKPSQKFKFLTGEPVVVHEFNSLEGSTLDFFIKKEAEKRNIKLAPGVIRFLSEIFKGDTWALVTELDKLALIENKNIDENKIKELVGYPQAQNQPKFFSQINDLLSGSLKQKTAVLEILLGTDDSAKIFNFLASFSGPFVKKFADYDAAVKSGKMDYEEALVDFALA